MPGRSAEAIGHYEAALRINSALASVHHNLAVQLSPDIILMDLSLPAPGGIETTQRVKRELPSAAIVVLATEEDEDALFESIKAGAAAFVLKDIAPDDLVTALS